MSEILTPSSLALRLTDKTGISNDIAKKFSTLFFSIVRKGLKNSDSFGLYNFGTFKKTWIEATVGLNPSTGEKIQIPAHWRIKFVPSSAVARRINKPYEHLKAVPLQDTPEIVEYENAEADNMPDNVAEMFDELALEKSDRISSAYISQENQQEKPAPAHKGLLKRAMELLNGIKSESPSECNEKKSTEICKGICTVDKKNPRLLVATGLGAIVLFLLIVLLIKTCSENSKGIPEKIDFETEIHIAAEEIESVDRVVCIEEKKSIEDAVNADNIKESLLDNKFSLYQVPSGSDYHTIAAEKYGNRHLWPLLYSANHEKFPDPDLIGVYSTIKVPELLSGEAGKNQIEGSVIEAYNGYLLMCEKQPMNQKNAERKKLAVRALVSGEILNPGFIERNEKMILPAYAEIAKKLAARK